MSRWPMIALSEVSRHRKEFIQIDDLVTYRRCRVQLHAKGIVLRDQLPGAEIKTKQQQYCRTGEFLVAEIDAKIGGYGIVPAELEGAIVSSHYFLFIIDESKLDRRFLGYFIRTPAFRGQVEAQGSTNYAAIRPSHVLAYRMPLPPLAEQRRIVEHLDALSAKIDEARCLRSLTSKEGTALMTAARRTLIGQSPDSTWIPLHSYVARIENGWSPSCEKRPSVDGEWGVLKVGAVSFGTYDSRENKALPQSLEPRPAFEVQPGDFLMSRANTSDLVGACAFVNSTPPRLMLSDKLFRFHFRRDKPVNLDYLDHVLKSPALRDQIVRCASGTSPTMKNISKKKVSELMIPSHDIADQQRITNRLNAVRGFADCLSEQQDETSAELDAILPAMLNRAFNDQT